MSSLSEVSTLQRTEQNFVLSSSRLPQYDCLAALGHKYKNTLIASLSGNVYMNYLTVTNAQSTYQPISQMINYGRAKRGDRTAEDGRKTERSSAPDAEAYSPRSASTCLDLRYISFINC